VVDLGLGQEQLDLILHGRNDADVLSAFLCKAHMAGQQANDHNDGDKSGSQHVNFPPSLFNIIAKDGELSRGEERRRHTIDGNSLGPTISYPSCKTTLSKLRKKKIYFVRIRLWEKKAHTPIAANILKLHYRLKNDRLGTGLVIPEGLTVGL
jgi:hypothetical protein